MSENHKQETEAQVNTADALQALACVAIEDKEPMAKLTKINLTLSHSLTQAQETILVLSKHLQALQFQTKKKTPATKITALDFKKRMLNRSATTGLVGETVDWTIPTQPAIFPRQDTN